MLCGVAGALFAGQQWLAENPETALGLAILVGAAAGGLFGYGAQVVFNLADPTISGLDIFTHVSWGVIAQNAFHGAVSGAVGGVLSPMLNAVGTRGLTKVALMAAGEFVSGRAQQIAVNVATPGRDWREDLFDPGRLGWWFDVGLDGIPGVAAVSAKGAWRGARSLRYADDVSLRRFDEGLDARRTFAAGCANSFVAGTLVQTEDGLVPIEDIDVGDRVLGEDPETGEQGFFEVVAVTNHPTEEVLAVTVTSVDDGEDEGQTSHSTTHNVMQITPEHPVYVEGKGWLLVENLELGDRLRRADGGMAKVLAIDQIGLDTPQAVYNFTVRGPHTYFVLDVGVLVHNATQCGPRQTKTAVDDGVNELPLLLPAPAREEVAGLLPPGPSLIKGFAPQNYPASIPSYLGSGVRGQVGEEALEALYPGGERQVPFETSWGATRRVDWLVEQGGRKYAYESKNYAYSSSATLSPRLEEEILKDLDLRRREPGYTPIWIFWDAAPSPTLAERLRNVGIQYTLYNP